MGAETIQQLGTLAPLPGDGREHRAHEKKGRGPAQKGAHVRPAATQPPWLPLGPARPGRLRAPGPPSGPSCARVARAAASAPRRLEAGLRVPGGWRCCRIFPGAGEPSGLEGGAREGWRKKKAREGRPPCPPRLKKMVFESVVVDVLNRFLGDYVVNLDTSQLTLGIWGGNEPAAAPRSRLCPCPLLLEPVPPFLGPRVPCLPGVATRCRPPRGQIT